MFTLSNDKCQRNKFGFRVHFRSVQINLKRPILTCLYFDPEQFGCELIVHYEHVIRLYNVNKNTWQLSTFIHVQTMNHNTARLVIRGHPLCTDRDPILDDRCLSEPVSVQDQFYCTNGVQPL